jgi:hypothetical protein
MARPGRFPPRSRAGGTDDPAADGRAQGDVVGDPGDLAYDRVRSRGRLVSVVRRAGGTVLTGTAS